MTAKEKVRTKYPRAHAERYRQHGGGGYSLIWADYGKPGRRLGEGKTTAAAWSRAARDLKDSV